MNDWLCLIFALFCWLWVALTARIWILAFPSTGNKSSASVHWILPGCGFLIWGWLTWIVQWTLPPSLHAFAPEIVSVIIGLSTAGVFLRLRKNLEKHSILDPEFIQFTSIFSMIFLTSAWICSFHPEITWGERPMDSTFLRYFARMPQLPPNDPWAAGVPMRYYYFGSYLFGVASKLLRIPGGVTYPLAIASVYTVFLSALVAILKITGMNLRRAFLGMILIGFAGNWNTLLGWLQNERTGFDLFWDASRILTPPSFSEFPLWSFLFYDLHSHFIGLIPEVCLIYALFSGISAGSRFWMGIAGFVFGILFFTNTWAWIAYSFLIFILMLLNRASPRLWWPFFTVAGIIGSLFFVHMPAGSPVGLPRFFNGSLETFTQLMLFSGHWWLLVVMLSCASLFHLARKSFRFEINTINGACGLGILAFLIWTLTSSPVLENSPPFACAIISVTVLSLFQILQKNTARVNQVAWMLILGGTLVTGISESIEWIDRMNTVFKWWIPSQFWIALGGVIVAMTQIRSRRALAGIIAVIGLPILIAGGKLIQIQTSHAFLLGPRPTLNGDLFLKVHEPDEYDAIRYLNSHATGIETLVEAPGGHYDGRARVAQFTGLPIVMGWEHHSRQRGVPDAEIQRRIQRIDQLYNSPSIEEKIAIAQELKIHWIFIGKKEIERYSPQGLTAFHAVPPFLPRFSQGNVRIFECAF